MLEAWVRPLLDRQVRDGLEPFLHAMRRRLERDRKRIHAYHDDLRSSSLKRLAALAGAEGDRAEADRRRETLRVEAIEREYRAKLDDLRHNYALRVTVEWIQALDLYVPVQRFDVLIRRRKGERVVQLDWHPLVKTAELPLCEAGLGVDRIRLVCDDKLHLTEPAGQAPCPSCSLGLSVSTDMPNEVFELMTLYPQPVRTQSAGGVEYLPVPRQKEAVRRVA